MRVKSIFLSWDVLATLAATLATIPLAPRWIPNVLVKDLSAVGIAVLAITFSVFFAALAIIMSSSDDEFVAFLEEDGAYTHIIGAFKFSLILLFVALVFSLFLYAYTSIRVARDVRDQGRWWSVSFEFLFLYSLFAALAAALDSIRYSEYRSRFILTKRRGAKRGERASSDTGD
jgi:hypothetical protein